MKKISLPIAVRAGAGLLWTASAVWTTVSVHHVIGNWATSGVVTAVIESAYGLATVWFHTSRTRLSTTALIAALVPVVAALAYADHDMFGLVGLAFAAGPLIAEGGFLLAAHLSLDPTAPTAEQRAELAQLLREAAHTTAKRAAELETERAERAAIRAKRAAELEDDRADRAAELETELSEIRAGSLRQMARESAVADVRVQRNELAHKLELTSPAEPERATSPVSLTSDNVTELRPSPNRANEPVSQRAATEPDSRAVEPNRATEPSSFGFKPDRAEQKRQRTELLTELLRAEPDASKARISEVTGIPQGSVDRYRKSIGG